MSAQPVLSEKAAPTPVVPVKEVEAIDSVSHPELAEAEELTNQLKRLLVRHESTLEQEGIRQQVETLERWMESYRRGLSAAKKISENGTIWLCELREKLKMAADELQRLEGEGGNPATKEQAARAEDLIKASKRIDEVIPNFESIFNTTVGDASTKETLDA